MHPTQVPDLTARQLHAVLTVAEYGSFIAAAAQLSTSQPALTRTIKRVEDVLGVRLFDRTTRRIEITAAGKEFVSVAERMLNDLRISVSSMRELGQEERGQLIISSAMSVANGLLPQMAAAYRAERPGIELHVREGVHGMVLEDVRSGAADLGITYVNDLPEFVVSTRIARETFVVVVPRGHVLAKSRKSKKISLDEVAPFPMVSLPSDSRTRRMIDGAGASSGHIFQHAATVAQFPTLMSFVRAGVGIAIVPSGALAGDLTEDLVRLEIAKPRLSRDLGLITLREREPTPAARGFAKLVQETWPKLFQKLQ